MKVAIIGAGASGLLAAELLLKKDSSAHVEIYEKLDRAGGRMSSPTVEGIGPIDSACQFLSIDDPNIAEAFFSNTESEAPKTLPGPILCLPDGFVIEAEGRFYFEGGMQSWADAKLRHLDTYSPRFKIHFQTEIKDTLDLLSRGFSRVLVTTPGALGKNLGAKKSVEYNPCLTLLFSWHNPPPEALEFFAFRDIENRDGLSWLAHESLKRGQSGIWIAQASPQTSKLWHRAQLNSESLEDLVRSDLKNWMPLFERGEKTLLHTEYWPEAFPLQFEDIATHSAFEKQEPKPGQVIYFLGDGYRGFGRIENALETAVSVVENMLATH